MTKKVVAAQKRRARRVLERELPQANTASLQSIAFGQGDAQVRVGRIQDPVLDSANVFTGIDEGSSRLWINQFAFQINRSRDGNLSSDIH